MTELSDHFTASIARRARWALLHNDGHPDRAWSTGEQLAVALVLRDQQHLDEMGYTADEAVQRVRGGMWAPPPPGQFTAWLDTIRAEIGYEVLP